MWRESVSANKSQSHLSPTDSKKGAMLGLERPAVSMIPSTGGGWELGKTIEMNLPIIFHLC